MKLLKEQLNIVKEGIVVAIMNEQYEVLEVDSHYIKIEMKELGLRFTLWIANTYKSFGTYLSHYGIDESSMHLNFTDDEKKLLYERFKSLHDNNYKAKRKAELLAELESLE